MHQPNNFSRILNQLAAISSASSTPKRARKVASDSEKDGKQLINVVVVGHVDAGKSTLMGHLLYELGYVDQRTIHKYRNEASHAGKASFAYAWVLDDTEQERARGVTMDIARTAFETATKKVVLLDAPGHKDFIPNMITGASQADAAILVINATNGEFETGFENGGQTREHAMLLRSFGISQILVAINKLDTVGWSKQRYDAIVIQIKNFLTRQAGFQSNKCTFVPVSGLDGDNLTAKVGPDHQLNQWYKGPTLLEAIDALKAPKRMAEGPLRIVITDVFKTQTNSISLAGKIESGDVMAGDKVYFMPTAVAATVKYLTSDTESQCDQMCCGEQGQFTLTGVFEPDTISTGHVIVAGGPDTLKPAKRFLVRLVVFDIQIPIMKGTRAELYCHSMCEPCTFIHLRSAINKSDGTVVKTKPRCLSRNMSGMVEIETDHEVAIEPYTVCRALGRITIRRSGNTIAVGIVEQTLA
ncbi:hypothetical protein WR25_06860 isoform A [Diploscapter pachys]|uniref:Tr-type G domain-containing protein n=2 Tax=Diploscapter pachys TaxID=2018661 RepID=A0A2A2JNT7_9BILA|nr:hypothetical protein WR25_06860 isoform A [Diploscapter pachys]